MDNKPVSPRKLAANRANAKRSTGPKTQAGKAKASQNAYKHGFHAKRLFPNEEVRAQDGADYEMVYHGLQTHYSPKGFVENLLVEEVATLYLRQARLLKFDQELQTGKNAGWAFAVGGGCCSSMSNIIRYETAATRRIQQVTERLEALQEKRSAEEAELGFEEGEDGDAAGALTVMCPEPPVTPSGEATEPPKTCDAREAAASLSKPLAEPSNVTAQPADARLVEKLRRENSFESLFKRGEDEFNEARN
jgi:hypothetical protein